MVSAREAYLHQTSFLEISQQLIDRGMLEELVHLPDQPHTMDSTGDYWACPVL